MTVTEAHQDDLGKLISLVNEVCTKSAIQKLLREARGTDGVRVSGSKDQVTSNLRDAVDRNVIPRAKVYEVLCASEENGSQHIFYYHPKSDALRLKYGRAEDIAAGLLGAQWRNEQKFPKFYLVPEGIVWSDFRIEGSDGTVGATWTAKLYAGIERRTFVEERPDGDNRVVRVYQKTLSREVYLVKWHGFGLLEMRVPRDSSTKAILNSLFGLWKIVQSAVSNEDFDPFDLTTASRKLIDGHSSSNYRLGDVHFLDSQTGSARFAPPSGEDDVMSDASRQEAIKFFDTCRELAVIWLPTTSTTTIEEEFRTVIGKIRSNEILFASKVTSEAVSYVTHRLWELAR